MDIKEKIRKLLALAESPNENEAKAALLKARLLMAENKISEKEIADIKSQSVERIETIHQCTKMTSPWLIALSDVIGTHYCCQAFCTSKYRKKTYTIGFIGLSDDVYICNNIFHYAADFILCRTDSIKKEMDRRMYGTSYIKRAADSYGYGFVYGLNKAYEEQDRQQPQEFGLVLSMPKEVKDATKDMKAEYFSSKAENSIDGSYYHDGYKDGIKFNPSRILKEKKHSNLLLNT